MIEKFFDDERHRRSEERAFFAERAERTGRLEEALAAYGEAAALEEEVARSVPSSALRIRTLLAVSAVSIWLKSHRWDEAARSGCFFLSDPAALTPDGRKEIETLVDRAWRSRELDAVLGPDHGGYVGLDARLEGGSVRRGIVPTNVVAERREVIVPMLFRVAEWRASRKFRKAGTSSFADKIEIFEAPALAASYTVRLFVGTAGQQRIASMPDSPQDVVGSFLELAEAASEGASAVGDLVRDAAYTKAFVRGFRDLAADGPTVESVELSSSFGLVRDRRVRLLPMTRRELSQTLQSKDQPQPVIVDGVLKAVNLRGNAPSLVVERQNEEPKRFRIAKGEHDDTIGPKLNRRVRILGWHEVSEDGETEDWAADVLLIEEQAREPV